MPLTFAEKVILDTRQTIAHIDLELWLETRKQNEN